MCMLYVYVICVCYMCKLYVICYMCMLYVYVICVCYMCMLYVYVICVSYMLYVICVCYMYVLHRQLATLFVDIWHLKNRSANGWSTGSSQQCVGRQTVDN